ncbi:MAG TPA: glycosyltransferase [Polyangiaceae bacterium]|nr:glycosyltransferase [Polyangiaceae bacterium]
MSTEFVWVVPCFDEEHRLDRDAFVSLVDSRPDIDVLFVDDGSTDRTRDVIEALARARPGRLRGLSLSPNRGKGEAVRRGLLHALSTGPRFVGYLDADLATPIREMCRLSDVLRDRGVDVVLGSRVALLGRRIERNSTRHYVGRVFASAASLMLGVAVYDTQCGAKIFRSTNALKAALAEPFSSRWVFDVELLARLLEARDAAGAPCSVEIVEEPLLEWREVSGSKLSLRSLCRAPVDMGKIALRLRGRARNRARNL